MDAILLDYLDVSSVPPAVRHMNSSCPTAPPNAVGKGPPRDEEDIDDRETVEWILPEEGLERPSDVRDRGVLLRIDRGGKGQLFSIPRDGATVGRARWIDLPIHDEGVSRQHARLSFRQGECFVEDLGSLNGVYVGGARVKVAVLADGDVIQIGPRATFRLAIMGSAEEESLMRLYDGAMTDPLTGLCNRRHLDELIEAESAFARRHHTDLSIIIFDIDHFKRVNDRYGHLSGDEVLRCVSRVFSEELRAEDVAARYGGEEFVALLRGERLAGARAVAERIRRRVGEMVIPVPSGDLVSVTISAGCATLRASDRTSEVSLLAVADARLYRAKEAGRNRICVAD